MRIIAGQRRGMVLASFDSEIIRPTKDIVKEFIFNCLSAMTDITTCRTCDLFAGTGGLGIEALSRGAPNATFVEQNPAAIALIEKNLRKSRLEKSASVVQDDVLNYLEVTKEQFDLILADPPYSLKLADTIMQTVSSHVVLSGIVVLEGSREEDPQIDEKKWVVHKQKTWGESKVTILRRTV